jgi:hypothetical protein
MSANRFVSVLALAAALAGSPAAHAHTNLSDASALSLLPVAVSVATPVLLVAGASVLTVAAVETSVKGTVWILERASDGARMSIEVAGRASVAAGTAVAVVALGSGWVLSAAGEAIAFVPSELGRALLHNERITL